MRKDTFTCDVCGVERKDANHWFVLSFRNDGHVEGVEVGISVLIYYWTDKTAKLPNVRHACGQQCVLKHINEFLSK